MLFKLEKLLEHVVKICYLFIPNVQLKRKEFINFERFPLLNQFGINLTIFWTILNFES